MSEIIAFPRSRAAGGLSELGSLLRRPAFWHRGGAASVPEPYVPTASVVPAADAASAPLARLPDEAPPEARSVAIRGQRKVIAHYRRLLAHRGLPALERLDFEARLAKAEAELLELGA